MVVSLPNRHRCLSSFSWLLCFFCWQRPVDGGALRGSANFLQLFSDEFALNIVLLVDRHAPYLEEMRKRMKEAAEFMKDKEKSLAFVEITTQHSPTFGFFNIHPEQSEELPVLMAVNWTDGVGEKPYRKYLLSSGSEQNLTAGSLQTFAESFLARSLKPWLRGQPIVNDKPADWDSRHGALEIVASQFDDEVTEDKDVFVMMFAAWCGFSKRMQPRVDELARHLKHVKTLKVLKIDAAENDIDRPIMKQLTGYPFLAFFPAGAHHKAEHVRVHADMGDAEAWRVAALQELRARASYPIPDPPPPGEEVQESSEEPESGLVTEEEF
eukprot:TRINITY_DN55053_c0_g1_i1.p1 TRINITY_DN55053_c0_g1~~TRINITY_DN55053_c0_g1_i1.p1  ORF type:complete len:353 (+),score=82.87 TRINITY_DN55053_c0_g1_i1:85-1059(+)